MNLNGGVFKMNRERFKQEYINSKNELDKKKMKDIVRSFSIANMDNEFAIRDPYNLVLAVEELSELQKAIIKYLRNGEDKMAVLEEMADVLISIMSVQAIVGIPTDDLYKAVNVKANRLENTIKEMGEYR